MAAYRAAAYLRLSREDGDGAESDSIVSQRSLVGGYIEKKPGITLVSEYVDDGYSGTSYDRPGFKKMMEDIRDKRINCVVVKDLSRLGRNYIETGKYIEKVFPFLGVRFIAVNDAYDSVEAAGDGGEIIVPFKNLLNDAFCRDISVKIRSQLDVKRRDGKFIGSFAPYGYRKDPRDKNRLIVDDYAAGVVREIFRMRLEGYSQQRIANHLNATGVLPPAEYKRRNGERYVCGFRTGVRPKWLAVTVSRILENEVYVGTMVQGKFKKLSYKLGKSRPVPREEWIRVEGRHESIVPDRTFESVQRLRQMDTRTSPAQERVYPFSGLVECGDCGGSMVRRVSGTPKNRVHYLTCGTHRATGECSSHLINVSKLESMVLEEIRRQAAALEEGETRETAGETMEPRHTHTDPQMKALEDEAARYRDLKLKAFADLRDGTLERDEYAELAARFSEKAAEAEDRRRALAESRRRETWGRRTRSLGELKRYTGITELDRRTVVSLVEKVVVHSRDRVEVIFRRAGELGSLPIAPGWDSDTGDEDERDGETYLLGFAKLDGGA